MTSAKLYAAAVVAVVLVAVPAFAQFGGPTLPLNTTLVLQKPAPDQTVNKRQSIDIGVKDHTYSFVLQDAWVDDPGGKWVWSDIWQSVNQSRPNFQVQGSGGDALVAVKPGEVVTVKGMYSMQTRTFVVSDVQPGGGPFAPKDSY